MVSTEVVTNLWFSITAQEFIIPEESSFFTFKVTKMNEGSGEWWLYAEDKNYFYTMETLDFKKSYMKISRKQANQIITFDKFNYKSWHFQEKLRKNIEE